MLDEFTRLAAVQTDFQSRPLGLRLTNPSQLRFQAGQAAVKSSSYQPGKSLQEAEMNLATVEEWVLTDPLADDLGVYSGLEAQEMSKRAQKPKNTYDVNLWKKLIVCFVFWTLRTQAMSDLFDEYPMLLFALEAGVALVIFVIIVVWTMMGRKDK